MNFILTLLGCLFVGAIVSLITFAIIHSKNYEKDFNRSWIVSTIIIAFLMLSLDFLYNSRITNLENMIYNANSLNELQLDLEQQNK